ncbi:MAG TPA: hypothetical protein VKA47_10510 [Solirubrobacterales bacterium]|nr:hypothetical protein [Solirubrobacterales bacterium]
MVGAVGGDSSAYRGPDHLRADGGGQIAFLEGIVSGPANLVGFSAGARVALLVALRRPDAARRVVLISGVFHRDGWVPDAIDPDASPSQVLARDYPGCVRGRAAPA